MKKSTEQAEGWNTKEQSWTDRKGTGCETDSMMCKHTQQNPAWAGIHLEND